ncbi:hypothetical protein [Actinokineospora xionganensis]|uniref:hypothetical protein n=1 Tax=Actinokineospora xionganensis TaxID=2684470 RepID=UPI001C9C9B7E|nr:hypothetical protein [Actinokineospora xionganensis]
MDDYSWPDDRALGERARQAWAATVAALPLGTHITGEVIGRQRFGVFPRIEGVPDAVGLVEIIEMPSEIDLPVMNALLSGTVIAHADHNNQVRIRPTPQ